METDVLSSHLKIGMHEMDPYVYADGSRMERGDLVWAPADCSRVMRIVGWAGNGAVIAMPLSGGGSVRAMAADLSRWEP